MYVGRKRVQGFTEEMRDTQRKERDNEVREKEKERRGDQKMVREKREREKKVEGPDSLLPHPPPDHPLLSAS